MPDDHSFIQNTHTHQWYTHLHTHYILHAVSPLTERFWAASAKRFIKTSKRMEPIISPCSVSLEGFLWEPGIWISCVICIHALSLEIPLNLHQALFFFSNRGGDEDEEAGVHVWQEKSCETIKDVHYNRAPTPSPLHISPTPPPPAVCQVFNYTASQMVLEWSPKNWLH